MPMSDFNKDFSKVIQYECPQCGSEHEPLIHDMQTSNCFICGYNAHPNDFKVHNEIGEIAFMAKYYSLPEKLN